ncbi:hypothetical protein HYPSUDRAFT_47394 [Hypholoma sublateritium FD-334 SS-4]|uniref:Uncharacterized protein n=1 Tax=Hypholoma sublateritium (strain FD-334 SS-4) TaxID=945553 RepID=A0A0D2NB33_HYPSF|nr:hypothetical protein HYPSUDRAFT_47394 [Hypholoma sublateritium FD-334 SS-4]
MGVLNLLHTLDYSHTQPQFTVVRADHVAPPVGAFHTECLREGNRGVPPRVPQNLKMREPDNVTRRGDVESDGSMVMRSLPLTDENRSPSDAEPASKR